MSREHAYEIPSAALAAHWWTKYTLPELLERAEAVRVAQRDALDKVKRAQAAFQAMADEMKGRTTHDEGI